MKRIYVIGDSISIQYGPYLKKYLQGVMAYSRKEGDAEARLNLDRPQGANGGDSAMVLAYLRAQANAGGLSADVLLLNCGLHDIKTKIGTGQKQVPLDQYRENLQQIVALVRQIGLQLVWLRSTPVDDKIHNHPGMDFHRFGADGRAYNEAADEIMRAAGIPIIDLYNFTLNLGDNLFCDHAHFHEHIREKQAAYIAGWLAGWLATG